uniref:Uncharacterized protein n=1 Tax=Ditylenchus dipsaci TaxID=166011 RepID=A0A915ERC0_9BILA
MDFELKQSTSQFNTKKEAKAAKEAAETAVDKINAAAEAEVKQAGLDAKVKDDEVKAEADEIQIVSKRMLTVAEAMKAEAARIKAVLQGTKVAEYLELVLKAANIARLSTPEGRQLVRNYANQYVQSEITRMQAEADAKSFAEAAVNPQYFG